jgi:hypothetical protein
VFVGLLVRQREIGVIFLAGVVDVVEQVLDVERHDRQRGFGGRRDRRLILAGRVVIAGGQCGQADCD